MAQDQGKSLLARLFEKVLPVSADFFAMMADQARHVESSVELLVEYMETANPALDARIRDDEHAADGVKVRNIHVLNEAFSTPIDREDIYRSFMNLDEIVNYCKDAVIEMEALGVDPDPYTLDMARQLRTGATALRNGYAKLGGMTADAATDAEAARKAGRAVEKIYRAALAALFTGDDYITMFKKREIYRHLTNAAECMAHTSRTLHDIVVKMT